MKLGSRNINDVEFVFPIDQRYEENPDPIIEDIIEKGTISGNGVLATQLGLKNSGVVVDVGCHIGRSSLPLAKHGMHDFILIDGCEQAVQCVKESIKKNQLTNVKVVHAVVSHSNFKCSFSRLLHSKQNIINKYIGFWKSLWYRKQAKTMYTKTIDQLVGSTECGTIIIDLEGYELPALHGAAATIARDLPMLIIQFDGQRFNLNPLLDLLHELDYQPYYLVNAKTEELSLALQEIREPCRDCQPMFALCIPKKEPIPAGLSVMAKDLVKTGNKKFDTREQLLEDIRHFRIVKLNKIYHGEEYVNSLAVG